MRTIAALAAVLLLAGCAGSATPSSSPASSASPTEPETVQITVRIEDTVPLAVYWNYDDVQCTGQKYMSAEVDRGPEVTIADGAGNVLAVKDAPLVGGTMVIKQSCTVDVEFPDVPAADIYVVTVKGHDGQIWDRTEAADGPDQVIRVSA